MGWYCSGPRGIQGCSLHDDTFLGSRVSLAEVSSWEALRRPWYAVSLDSLAVFCSQVAWMPGWDWTVQTKVGREGTLSPIPALSTPWSDLFGHWMERCEETVGTPWGCRLKAFYLGTRRAKAELTEDVTFFFFCILSGTALAAPALDT